MPHSGHTVVLPSRSDALALLGNLFAQPAMVLDSLAGAEVAQLEQLPDLDFVLLVMGVGAALDPLDRFRKRLTLQDPVARYQFLGLREWAVYYAALVAGRTSLERPWNLAATHCHRASRRPSPS